MIKLPANKLKKVNRRSIAGVMTMIYLAITLSPLATFAMHSKVVAHVVTGECAGDCDICGCSQESRANHTCCCTQKKRMQSSVAKLTAGECSSPHDASSAQSDAKGSCCDASQSTEQGAVKNACCAKSGQHPNDEKRQDPNQNASPPKTETVFKCGCPCGKSELPSLSGTGSSELLPYIYSERIVLPHEDTHYTLLPQSIISRHTAPPDPPPKITSVS
jgi:hypothetical protein